jgi:hypothetical protein
MRTMLRDTSWVVESIRCREAELADACASAAVNLKDPRAAVTMAELVFEHLRHSRPRLECSKACAQQVDRATMRRRAQAPLALPDVALDSAVETAVVYAIARTHAEVALFINDACATLLVAPVERERLLHIAFCTAALGDGLRPGL